MFGIDDIILGATITGAATSIFGAFGKKKAQDRLTEDEIAGERLRRTQMEYDAMRQQRSLIRNAQMARATGLANQTASGADNARSSASGGREGQVQGTAGVQSNSIFQNLKIGEGLFDVNERIAKDKRDIQTGSDIMGLGSMISSMGSPLGRMFGGRGSSNSQSSQGTSSGSDPFSGDF